MKRKWWLLLIVLVLALAACRENKGATHSDMNNEQQARTEADTQLDERITTLEDENPAKITVVKTNGVILGIFVGNVAQHRNDGSTLYIDCMEVFIPALNGTVLIDYKNKDYFRDHLVADSCSSPTQTYTADPNPSRLLISSNDQIYRRRLVDSTLMQPFSVLAGDFDFTSGIWAAPGTCESTGIAAVEVWPANYIGGLAANLPLLTGSEITIEQVDPSELENILQ